MMRINSIQSAVLIPYADIAAFCIKRHIIKLWLFGSVLRNDFTAESDVDVLVEFDPNHIPAWEFYSTWVDELVEIFGHPVDLTTPESLSKYIRKKVMQSAMLIYERA